MHGISASQCKKQIRVDPFQINDSSKKRNVRHYFVFATSMLDKRDDDWICGLVTLEFQVTGLGNRSTGVTWLQASS